MKRVALFYDDIFLAHETPRFHPESKDRLVSIMNALRSSGTWGKLVHEKPRRAEPSEIASVHTPQYIEKMSTFTGHADPDTFISEGTYEAALYAAGPSSGRWSL